MSEQLNITENEQPEGTEGVNETISTQQDTENPNQNMEVHHHPDLHHEKKIFREYFLEFIMIFLAVTMGFFAEQIREYYVESHHEKQLMVSLVKDLESDTLQLESLRKFRVDRLNKIDSIIIFFARNSTDNIPLRKYNIIKQVFGHAAFFQNTGTIDQLTNSSGLRLIHKRNIVDSIESYVQQNKRMILRDRYETDFLYDNSKLVQKLFDGISAIKIHVDTTYFHGQVPADQSIPIHQQYLDEYLNSLVTMQRLIQSNMGLQVAIRSKARRLLLMIKKEYNQENYE